MWSREWNIKMRSWIKVYIIVEKSLFGDINMEVDIWKKWISLWCAKNTFPSSGEKAHWWLEGCGQGRWKVVDSGLHSSTRQGAAAQESWSGIGPSGRWEGVGEKISKKQGVPEKIPTWQKKIGAQSRVGLKHRAMFSTFGSSDHYCEPGIVNTGPYSRVRVDSFVLTKILQKRLNHITR